jgi:hypothetical protein
MLSAVPDLRPALAAATPEDLAELMETFDITARYNHPAKTLELSIVLAPELADRSDRPRAVARSGV